MMEPSQPLELWQKIGIGACGLIALAAIVFVAWLTATPFKVLPFRKKR